MRTLLIYQMISENNKTTNGHVQKVQIALLDDNFEKKIVNFSTKQSNVKLLETISQPMRLIEEANRPCKPTQSTAASMEQNVKDMPKTTNGKKNDATKSK